MSDKISINARTGDNASRFGNARKVDHVALLDVNRGNFPLLEEIIDQIEEISVTGRFIGGDQCKQLEREIADYCDAKFGIGCASGSDALLISLMAMEIGPGDEVILPSFTFFATASAISRLGAKPVFVDIEEGSFNLDPEAVDRAINGNTRAIIPVHLFGQCAEMDAINELAQRHGLRVIEDAAQAIGARYKDRAACSLGDVGCLSFYPTKNLGGFGDGGMMVTNDPELAVQLRKYANHGMQKRYYHESVGVNSRLDTFQAAALCVKLKHLPEWTRARRRNAARYHALLASRNESGQLVLPTEESGQYHVWNQYTMRVPAMDRDAFREQLQANKVGSEIYYPVPLHMQECFKKLGYGRGSLPRTEQAAREVVSLPIYPELEAHEQEYVAQQVDKALDTATHKSLRRSA